MSHGGTLTQRLLSLQLGPVTLSQPSLEELHTAAPRKQLQEQGTSRSCHCPHRDVRWAVQPQAAPQRLQIWEDIRLSPQGAAGTGGSHSCRAWDPQGRGAGSGVAGTLGRAQPGQGSNSFDCFMVPGGGWSPQNTPWTQLAALEGGGGGELRAEYGSWFWASSTHHLGQEGQCEGGSSGGSAAALSESEGDTGRGTGSPGVRGWRLEPSCSPRKNPRARPGWGRDFRTSGLSQGEAPGRFPGY